MKKLLLIVCVLTFTGVYSQQSDAALTATHSTMTKEERVHKKVSQLAEKLQLTESQKQQVLELHLEKAKQREAKRTDQKADMKNKKEAFKAEKDKYHAQMKEILTDEQYARWQELKKIKKQNMKAKKQQKYQKKN